MPKKTKGLSWEDHGGLGAELFHMRNRLLNLTLELEKAYGTSSKVVGRVINAQSAIDNLRSELDNLIGKDCPEKTDKGLNRCYYPGNNPEA